MHVTNEMENPAEGGGFFCVTREGTGNNSKVLRERLKDPVIQKFIRLAKFVVCWRVDNVDPVPGVATKLF